LYWTHHHRDKKGKNRGEEKPEKIRSFIFTVARWQKVLPKGSNVAEEK
jgi:hypothetical protein